MTTRPIDPTISLASSPRVLLVEDDEDVALTLAHVLERQGHVVSWVESGSVALEHLTRHHADLVVLDLGLPDFDGLEVCARARAEGYAGGLIILTGRGEEADRVLGLDQGADDYVVKPVGLVELQARVRALLRRTLAGPGQWAAG